ncbi:hypothetical protein A3C67_01610 [Candidatus Nomurabacteria bacterium RIFCSPHIGHO2_02_FULL_42_19]|uniref:Uncharacterized protein n=1 Tax=Candidatus Nomurabacteria bacterium RIFCSPHIGHO2_02_FULL_42_19 TaxID=1801756 RepID=A0A1F6W2T7_9BACT|nr:MAG: hypothetical protein A3C67_01610 [Candidatus Nomurabacteria bacterium RIFCSPHIGHO2_02_FULL_42_19]
MFKIENKLKKAAQKRAKKEGITLSDFYQSATKSFVAGRLNVGLTIEDDSWDNYTKRSKINFKRGLADLKAGRIKLVR